MHALWHWLLYVLTWSSVDAGMLEVERARTAGSVAVAYATLASEPIQTPAIDVQPASPTVCPKCDGSGRIYRPDGGWVKCPCGACTTGRCPAKGRASQ